MDAHPSFYRANKGCERTRFFPAQERRTGNHPWRLGAQPVQEPIAAPAGCRWAVEPKEGPFHPEGKAAIEADIALTCLRPGISAPDACSGVAARQSRMR